MSTWGRARIEVIAMRDHILHELRRGVPMKQIFDGLASGGQVTVTYNSFRRQIQALREEALTSTEPQLTARNPYKPAGSPRTASSTNDASAPQSQTDHKAEGGFIFDPSRNADDFF